MSDASPPEDHEPDAASLNENTSSTQSLRQRKSTQRAQRNQALAEKVAQIKSKQEEAERWGALKEQVWTYIKPLAICGGVVLAAACLYWLIYYSPVFELDESLFDADGDGIIDVEDDNII